MQWKFIDYKENIILSQNGSRKRRLEEFEY
jgi:hypothetical protein